VPDGTSGWSAEISKSVADLQSLVRGLIDLMVECRLISSEESRQLDRGGRLRKVDETDRSELG
jgi:hypothetical protein